jgi:dihydropteroate synthase
VEGSLATAVASVLAGANIIRAHDVAETTKAVKIADAIRFGYSPLPA